MASPREPPEPPPAKMLDPRATEEQVSMKSTVPQRVDAAGSKIEDLGGTGVHDSQGG